MKNSFLMILTLLIFISGCSGRDENLKKPSPVTQPEIINYWLDAETGTVHKFVSENGAEKIVSVIKYKSGKPLEVMKIITAENSGGKLHWIYFVPSTGYVVELTTVLISEKGISIEWKNKTPEGEEDSGSDLLVRCNETGIMWAEGGGDDESLPDDPSSLINIE